MDVFFSYVSILSQIFVGKQGVLDVIDKFSIFVFVNGNGVSCCKSNGFNGIYQIDNWENDDMIWKVFFG